MSIARIAGRALRYFSPGGGGGNLLAARTNARDAIPPPVLLALREKFYYSVRMSITLPQEQQDWLDAQVAASRFSSIDEALAAAVASYMAGNNYDASSALEDFRREIRMSIANPDGWRTASPLTASQSSVAVQPPASDLRQDEDEAGGAGQAEEIEDAPEAEQCESSGPGHRQPSNEEALTSP
jgi:Arc/MetJ-type ribon-helix-helix transcriptional regulator